MGGDGDAEEFGVHAVEEGGGGVGVGDHGEDLVVDGEQDTGAPGGVAPAE